MTDMSQVSPANEYVVSFRNEFADLEAYYDYYLQTPDGKRFSRLIFFWMQGFALFLSIIFGGAVWLISGRQTADAVFTSALVLLSSEFILWWRSRLRRTFYAKQALKKNAQRLDERQKRFFLMPRECRISHQGLELRSEISTYSWAWEAIDQIVCSDEYIFLKIGSFSYVIPKRSFSGNISFQAFCQALEIFYKERADRTALSFSVRKPSQIGRRRLILGRILLIVVFLGLCFAVGAFLNAVFEQPAAILPGSDMISSTLDGYLRAMQRREIDEALTYFFAPNAQQREMLEEQLKGVNYAAYSDYERLEIDSWSLEYYPDSRSATIRATLYYQSGSTGMLLADLETQAGAWKIKRISLFPSPQQVERYLERTR